MSLFTGYSHRGCSGSTTSLSGGFRRVAEPAPAPLFRSRAGLRAGLAWHGRPHFWQPFVNFLREGRWPWLPKSVSTSRKIRLMSWAMQVAAYIIYLFIIVRSKNTNRWKSETRSCIKRASTSTFGPAHCCSVPVATASLPLMKIRELPCFACSPILVFGPIGPLAVMCS